jgi:hypothetical protein
MIMWQASPAIGRGDAPAHNGHEPVIKVTSALVPNPLSIRPFTWSSA